MKLFKQTTIHLRMYEYNKINNKYGKESLIMLLLYMNKKITDRLVIIFYVSVMKMKLFKK